MTQFIKLNFKYHQPYFLLSVFAHCNQFSFIHSLVPSEVKLKTLFEKERLIKKRVFKDYFIENLFINRYQEDILEYPEFCLLKEFELLKKKAKIIEELFEHRISSEGINLDLSSHIISTLKKLELFGFKLPKNQNGFGFTECEFNYLQDIISVFPSVSKTVSQHEDFGIQLINLFGNDAQKKDLLPKITTGENIVCLAHLESEPLVTVNLNEIKTNAFLSSDGKSYTISGKKQWVYNGINANILIFSAKVVSENVDEKQIGYTFFLINKNLSGVKLHTPAQKIGLKGVDICELTFNNVKVPAACVLGNIHKGDEHLKQLFTNGRLHSAADCCGIMRRFINQAINHCIHNKFFNQNKYEIGYYKKKIGHLVSRLYAVESMIYLVSGRFDDFYDPNLFLESLILKIFSSENLQYVLNECMQIIGTDLFSSDSKKIIRDSQFYSIFDDSNDHLKFVLSFAGCKYVKEYKMKTNPFKRLWTEVFNKQYLRFIGFSEDCAFSDKLSGYLHLKFEDEAKALEIAVFKLKNTVNYLFKKHGDNIFNRCTELKLLSDLVIDIYAITAILSRASRSYCVGVKYQEVDYSIAKAEVSRIFTNFKDTKNMIMNENLCRNLEKVGSNILQSNYTELIPNPTKFKLKN